MKQLLPLFTLFLFCLTTSQAQQSWAEALEEINSLGTKKDRYNTFLALSRLRTGMKESLAGLQEAITELDSLVNSGEQTLPTSEAEWSAAYLWLDAVTDGDQTVLTDFTEKQTEWMNLIAGIEIDLKGGNTNAAAEKIDDLGDRQTAFRSEVSEAQFALIHDQSPQTVDDYATMKSWVLNSGRRLYLYALSMKVDGHYYEEKWPTSAVGIGMTTWPQLGTSFDIYLDVHMAFSKNREQPENEDVQSPSTKEGLSLFTGDVKALALRKLANTQLFVGIGPNVGLYAPAHESELHPNNVGNSKGVAVMGVSGWTSESVFIMAGYSTGRVLNGGTYSFKQLFAQAGLRLGSFYAAVEAVPKVQWAQRGKKVYKGGEFLKFKIGAGL